MSLGAIGLAGNGQLFQPVAVEQEPEYIAMLSIGGLHLASDPYVYEGIVYEPGLTDFPQQSESSRDEFGLVQFSDVTVTIGDPLKTYRSAAAAWRGEEALLRLLQAPRGGAWTETKQKYRIVRVTRAAGAITLTLSDFARTALEQTYPDFQLTSDDFPEIFTDHVGRILGVAVGTAVKLPCFLVDTNGGAGPWKYAVNQVIAGYPRVLTVYRDGAIAGQSTEATPNTLYTIAGDIIATVTRESINGVDVQMVTFELEQADTSGRFYALEADVRAAVSRNPATELARMLAWGGFSLDSVSKAAAIAEMETLGLSVDIGYGRDGQRTLQAIVEQLQRIARIDLRRDEQGQIEFVQDRARSAVQTLSEEVGDALEIGEYEQEEIPAILELKYRPTFADASELKYTISRSITGGTGPKGDPLELDYLRDFATADQVLDYEAKLLQYRATARAKIGHPLQLGDRVTLTSDTLYDGALDWSIDAVDRQDGVSSTELRAYNAAIYTYTPGAPPSENETDYKPDYSLTQPAAPSGLEVDTDAAVIDNQGHVTAKIHVRCIPPSVNWAKIRFTVQDTETLVIARELGEDEGGGYYGITMGGFRPGVLHDVLAIAISPTEIEGVAASVSHTMPTDATVPPTVAGVNASQGSGKVIRVAWTPSTDADFWYYKIQRQINGGGWSTLGTGQQILSNLLLDVNVNYGNTYEYRVKAVDHSGNESAAWSNPSAGVELDSTIGDGDIDPTDPIQGTKLDNLIADTITAGTITAITFQTSTSNQRIIIDKNNNELRVYSPSGTLIGSFGYSSVDGDDYLVEMNHTANVGAGYFRTSSTNKTMHIENAFSGQACYVKASSGQAMRIDSSSGSQIPLAVYGSSSLGSIYADRGINCKGKLMLSDGGSNENSLEWYDSKNIQVTFQGSAPRYIGISQLLTTPET